MVIGVPKEIKANENRVALLPVGAQMLIKNNHKVVVETNAGIGSGFSDGDYKNVGAEIAKGPEEIFSSADMIMKVKEPINNEYNMIRRRHHASARPEIIKNFLLLKNVLSGLN